LAAQQTLALPIPAEVLNRSLGRAGRRGCPRCLSRHLGDEHALRRRVPARPPSPSVVTRGDCPTRGYTHVRAPITALERIAHARGLRRPRANGARKVLTRVRTQDAKSALGPPESPVAGSSAIFDPITNPSRRERTTSPCSYLRSRQKRNPAVRCFRERCRLSGDIAVFAWNIPLCFQPISQSLRFREKCRRVPDR